MLEAIQTEPHAAPAADIAEVLLIQIFALDALFRRALKDARSHRDIGRALKAQARCRATVKNALWLCGPRRAKRKNSRIRTRELLRA